MAAIAILANAHLPAALAAPEILLSPAAGATPGAVTYTPNTNFFGPDSLTFQARDGTYASNAATAAISISPVNDASTLSDLQQTVD